MQNTVQRFLRKYATIKVKFCSTNKKKSFRSIGFKKSFQTALRASAVDIIKHVSAKEDKILLSVTTGEGLRSKEIRQGFPQQKLVSVVFK